MNNRNPDIIDAPMPPAVYKEMPFRKLGGILTAIIGFGWCVSIGFTTLLLLAGASLAGELGLGAAVAGFCTLIAAGCGFLGWKGMAAVSGLNRFQKYKKLIGDDELCNIRQLAEGVGKSDRFVVKDVEKMIRNGWFCQGHLDDKKTCLMVTDHMYREYRKIEQEKERLRLEEEAKQLQKQAEEDARRRRAQAVEEARKLRNVSPEVERVLEQGERYVEKIRQCNDAIPGEVISEKLVHMEILVNKIFARVEQNPECVGDIRKLMEYYLPTTVKLLETYAEMDAQPIGGANIRTAKKEIEDTLDTINLAYEKLLDSLFEDAAWDVSSDISVLHTMLAQEGLTEDGLNKKNNNRED